MKRLILCFLLCLPLSRVLAQDPVTVEPVESIEIAFGRSPNVFSVVVGADDTIYLLDQYQGIMIFSPRRELQGTVYRDGLFNNPEEILMDLALGEAGTFWVASTINQTVYKLDSQGNILLEIGGFGPQSPRRIETDAQGNVYVFDSYNFFSRGRIRVFAADSTPLAEFPVQVDENESGFVLLVDIAVSAEGTVYLTEYGEPEDIPSQMRVFSFDRDELTASLEFPAFGEGNLPLGSTMVALSSAGNQLAVVGNAAEKPIHLLDSEGNLLAEFGELLAPRAVAFFPDGDLLVVTSSIAGVQFTRFAIE